MYKLLLTTLSLAACTAVSTAQTYPVKEVLTFNVEGIDPEGNMANGDELTMKGSLSGGTVLPNASGFGISSLVSTFNPSGTTSSFNNGEITFTGSVGLITTAAQLIEASEVVSSLYDLDCEVLDFSFTQCTIINEESDLFTEISSIGSDQVFFGFADDPREAVTVKEAFVFDEKTRTFSFDSSALTVADSKEDRVLSFFILDERGNATDIKSNADTITVFKDFTVCVECVPEPSSTLLMGMGAAAFIIRRRR